MKNIIEGLLFVVGDEGLTLEEINNILKQDINKTKQDIEELIKDYEDINRGIRIEIFGDKYKLVTKKEYKDYLKKLVPDEEDLLTQSNLETLAIIAYNQPITRLQVEEIRGVSTTHTMRKLLMRDLIKELGRSELPGRPILYGTTDFFLDYFGINSLEELPQIKIEEQDEEEENLFESKYKEEI